MSTEEEKEETKKSILRPEDPQAEEGHILGIVMDRTGDTRYDGKQNPLLTVIGAVMLARAEMSKGKWLRTVDKDGKSDIIRDVKDLADEQNARKIFEDVSEMEMMAALQGG